jgi:hypothetical protein
MRLSWLFGALPPIDNSITFTRVELLAAESMDVARLGVRSRTALIVSSAITLVRSFFICATHGSEVLSMIGLIFSLPIFEETLVSLIGIILIAVPLCAMVGMLFVFTMIIVCCSSTKGYTKKLRRKYHWSARLFLASSILWIAFLIGTLSFIFWSINTSSARWPAIIPYTALRLVECALAIILVLLVDVQAIRMRTFLATCTGQKAPKSLRSSDTTIPSGLTSMLKTSAEPSKMDKSQGSTEL